MHQEEKALNTSQNTDSMTKESKQSPRDSENLPQNAFPRPIDRLTTIREGSASLEESRLTV